MPYRRWWFWEYQSPISSCFWLILNRKYKRICSGIILCLLFMLSHAAPTWCLIFRHQVFKLWFRDLKAKIIITQSFSNLWKNPLTEQNLLCYVSVKEKWVLCPVDLLWVEGVARFFFYVQNSTRNIHPADRNRCILYPLSRLFRMPCQHNLSDIHVLVP